MLKSLIFLILLAILAGGAWVRLAPTDPLRWHVMPEGDVVGNVETAGSYTTVRQITTRPEAVLEALDRIAMATPRTIRLAGSVESGMITYETRSLIAGFPDYTTAAIRQTAEGPLLVVHGRLRFGQGDLGVNKVRVNRWLDILGPLTVRP